MISTTAATRPSGFITISQLAIGIVVATGLAALVRDSGTHEFWPVALAVPVFALAPLVYGFGTLRQWLTLAP